MTESFIYATSASAGVQVRYKQDTIGTNTVFTDVGSITDYSSATTGWTVKSDALGGLGLVQVTNLSAVTGLQVSGTVNVSGPVAVTSGGVIPVSQVSTSLANFSGLYLASGLYFASGISVTLPTANLSGLYLASGLSLISGQNVTMQSGIYLASGLWLASGIVMVDNLQINNSANVDTFVGFGSTSIAIPVVIKGSVRNVSSGVFGITASAGAGVNMSGDYVIWANVSGYKLRVNYLQAFNSGTTSSQLVGFATTSATGGQYFKTFLQPQQGWNANLVGANWVLLSGQPLYGTLATVSGQAIDFTVIGEQIPNSWVEGLNP